MKQRPIYLIICIFMLFVTAFPKITNAGIKDEWKRGGNHLKDEVDRGIDKIESQYKQTARDIKEFPQKAQDERIRLQQLGMTEQKIREELHRTERLLRAKIGNIKSEANLSFQDFFDINKHMKEIITGVSAKVIISEIIKAANTGQDALMKQKLVGKFLDMELIEHVKIIDVLFLEFNIYTHIDRDGIRDCFNNVTVNFPFNIPSEELLWPCIENQLKPEYTKDILLIAATTENIQKYKTYKEEIEKRIGEVATLQDRLFSLTKTVDSLDQQMSQAKTQALQALSSQNP